MGSSIHSSGQLEWFKTLVDEKSIKVGGTKLITTLDGYSVPLLIRDGLAYATSLGKPTDQDMDTYPYVFFTSPDEWDPQSLTMILPHLDGLDPSQVSDQHLVTPCLMLMEILMSALLPTSTSSWMHLQEIVDHTQQSPLFPKSISIRVHPKSLIGMLYAHCLHGHPHPASRTLSMSPPGMELLHIPRITSRNILSLEILSSTSPDAVKRLQQTPSSLTPLLLMMVQPWPNFSVAEIPLSVMHMASNQPNKSTKQFINTLSDNIRKRGAWTPSSVMEKNMKSPSESLISSGLCSFKIISLNLIINIK